MKITYKDLDIEPCNPYKLYILENYGKDKKFDPLELIKKFKKDYEDVSWLIAYCKEAQTPEMLIYFKSLYPSADDVDWLIKNCKYCQTLEMLYYYKSLKPNADDVSYLILYCKFCQTPKNKKLLLKGLE